MKFLKNNFMFVFVVVSMVIIGIGSLVYDVNKASLSAGVADIIKIGDTAIIKVYESVDLKAGIGDIDNVEYNCSVDDEIIANVLDCEVYGLSYGKTNAKIQVLDTTDGEVLDEKTVSITVNKTNMIITDIPSALTLNIGEEYSIKPNTNGTDATLTYEYDESMFKVVENDNGPDKLVALKEGTSSFKIIYTPTLQNKYESSESTISITVKNVSEPPISVEDIEMYVGETKEINVNTNDVVGGLNFSIDDTSIASLNNMNVTGIKEGKTTITVVFNPEDTDKYKTVTKTINVVVNKKEDVSDIDEFITDLNNFINNEYDSSNNIKVNYDKTNKILSLSYCEKGCLTSNVNSTIKLSYDEQYGILKINNSIKLFDDFDNYDFSDEYNAIDPLMQYILKQYGSNNNLDYSYKTGANIYILSIKNNGFIRLFNDYKKTTDSIYLPQSLQNFEIDIKNGIKSNSSIYKVNTSSKNGSVVVNNIKYSSGKDIVTLSIKANDNYAFDSLVIKDSNGNDITKELNFNSSTMSFEMPSKDVSIEAVFINNAKTGVYDMSLMLLITMIIFGIGLYIVRKNVNSLEI